MSPKMEKFIDEYMIDMNASQAVMRAGYECQDKNKNRVGTQLLNHPLVRAAINQRLDERAERLSLSEDYVIKKLLALVEDLEVKNGDKIKSLELLGRHLGLYRDRQEISGPDGGAIELEQRVQEDVADFTSRIARLADRAGTNVVPLIVKPGSTG